MQHDFNIANQGFPATRADINNAFQAIASNSSGPTAPSTTYANMWWYDETNNKMYLRNEADSAWIEVATIDQTNNEWQITTGQISAVDGDGLVFKTDDGITRLTISDAGGITVASGLTVDNDGATVLTVDRATSDGSIIDFAKDGSTVGSIGTVTDKIYIGSSAGGDAFLRLNSSTVTPANSSGADRDATINLGYSGGRFKDLYLSGGVYLGGTAAANQLDDYEEGTWTPVLACLGQSGSFTHTTQAGHYRKIGQLVFVTGRADWTAKPSAGANFQVTGLPFAYSGNSYANDLGISVGYYYGIPNTDGLSGKVQQTGGGSRTAVGFYSDGSGTVNVTTGNNISTSGQIRFSLTYFTA